MIKSEEFKVLGAPLLLPKNKRAQAVATIAYKQIIRVANPAAKKAVTLAMKDIAGEKRLNDNDSFTPVYVKYKKIRDNTGNLILYGDINDEVSAIITAQRTHQRKQSQKLLQLLKQQQKQPKFLMMEELIILIV